MDETEGRRPRRAWIGQAILMLSAGVFLVTGYGAHFVVGHGFGPEVYGRVGLAIAVMTAANFLLTTGIASAVTRETASLPHDAAHVARRAGQASLVLGFGGGAALGFSAWIIHDASPPVSTLVLAASTVIPAYAAASLLQGILNSRFRFGLQGLGVLAGYLIRFGVILFAVLAARSPVLVILAYGFGAAGTALLILVPAARLVPDAFRRADPTSFGGFLRVVVSSTILQGSVFVLMNADLLLLSSLGMPTTTFGVYVAAATVAKVPFYVSTSIGSLLLPYSARPFTAGAGSRSLTLAVAAAAACGILWFLALGIFAAPFFRLAYGSTFSAAPRLVLPMAPGGVALAVVNVVATHLFARGRSRSAVAVIAVALGLLVGALVLAAPTASPTEFAWIVSSFTVCAALALLALLRRGGHRRSSTTASLAAPQVGP